MPLEEVRLDAVVTLPGNAERLIAEAERRMEAFFCERAGRPVPGFVPSDFREVYRGLAALLRSGAAPGDCFCEWGSGFGVVAALAAQLELSSHGIEIDPDLVDEAERLAADFDLEVAYACGTFVPPGGEPFLDLVEDFDWLEAGGGCGHDLLDLDPEDLDLVFAYPWPGEEHVVEGLFERFCAPGALLLTHHGGEGLRLRRKT